jgi:3-dehydroquinate synthase
MKTFTSTFGNIHLGKLDAGLFTLLRELNAFRFIIVADDHTAQYCVPLLETIIGSHPVVIIPHGEINKTLDGCKNIWSGLIQHGADRSSVVLNVGGGMICDMGGFAAASYQRGIRFVHIPTSLLAMTDAAMGGKTGVDYEGYKNYIGYFAAPQFTWIDPVFLKTLPQPQIREGLAEMIKHAIIGSCELWDLLEKSGGQQADWMSLLALNIGVKTRITDMDPREKGIRKTLNFGHTIGHALESYFLHSPHPLTHGEAVTLGMMAESWLARESGQLQNEDFDRIITLIRRMLSPAGVTLPSLNSLLPWLDGDKKKSGGRLGFSLPTEIGSCTWDIEVSQFALSDCLDWLGTQV